VTNPLKHVSDSAINHRRQAAERIAEQVEHKTLGVGYGSGYRPTLLELENERRRRKDLPPYTDKLSGALLPPGGEAQLRKMQRDYRRKVRRQGGAK